MAQETKTTCDLCPNPADDGFTIFADKNHHRMMVHVCNDCSKSSLGKLSPLLNPEPEKEAG